MRGRKARKYAEQFAKTLSIERQPPAEHPIDALRKAGVPVSINTDDPALLNTTLEDSYKQCAATFAWDKETIRSLAATSIAASYADPAIKARIKTELTAW